MNVKKTKSSKKFILKITMSMTVGLGPEREDPPFGSALQSVARTDRLEKGQTHLKVYGGDLFACSTLRVRERGHDWSHQQEWQKGNQSPGGSKSRLPPQPRFGY